ncbi:MAG: hypothetical protein ACR2FP_09165, partial [Nocardioidaceae bacterium]
MPRPEPMPHASTNTCHRVGDSVTKAYAGPDAAARQAREEAALWALADRLPVATVLDSQPGVLTTAYVDGVPGQELICEGRAEAVVFGLGRLLTELQSVPRGFLPAYDGTGVLVHPPTSGLTTRCSTPPGRRCCCSRTGNGARSATRWRSPSAVDAVVGGRRH